MSHVERLTQRSISFCTEICANLEKQALLSVCNGGRELSIGERAEGAFAQTVAIPHVETSWIPGPCGHGVVGDSAGCPAWVSQGQLLLPGVTQGLEKLPLAPGLLLATLSNAFRCYICIVSKVNSPLFMP